MTRIAIIFFIIVGLAFLITAGVYVFTVRMQSNTKIPSITKSEKEAFLYISHDGGAVWQPWDAARGIEPRLIEFKNGDPATLYIGTKNNGLWVSRNRGETFTRVIDPSGIINDKADIYDIAQSKNGDVLYLALFQNNHGRLIRLSENKAEEVSVTPLKEYGIFGVAVSPTDDRHISIASGDGNFLESVDGGISWETIAQTKEGIVRLLKHPTRMGKFWGLGNNNTLYSTETAGRLWYAYSNLVVDEKYTIQKVYDVVYSPLRASLLIGSDYGLAESFDNGKTWHSFKTPIPPKSTPITALAVHPRFREVFWIAAGSRVYRTDDGGITWERAHFPETIQSPITMLKVDSTDPKRIYAGLSK